MAVICLSFASACNREPGIDEVPIGSDVQLTRQDGALVEGTLAERDRSAVQVAVGPTTRSVPRAEIADLRVKDPARPSEVPATARFREITVPASTRLAVRLDTAVGSATSEVETPVRGELTEAVVIDGIAALPAGSNVSGTVTGVQSSGKVKGRASLALEFDRISAHGESYPLKARFARTAAATKGQDAEKIALPAVGGAIIGAIVGGNKGAAIGAAAGGGAGTAVVLSTSGPEIALETGTVLSLDAGREMVVRVPIR
jgi:hypothetical protein